MNIVSLRENGTNHLVKAWLVIGVLALCAPVSSRAINYVAPATGAVNPGAVAPQAAPAGYSAGVADIVRMVAAKVDPQVITTYIRTSPIAYNPNASEIIALKDQGVGPEILTAMLQRGAEVRGQAMQGAQPAVVADNPYAPAYAVDTQPAYATYATSYPVTSYVYPAYDYGYPGFSYGYRLRLWLAVFLAVIVFRVRLLPLRRVLWIRLRRVAGRLRLRLRLRQSRLLWRLCLLRQPGLLRWPRLQQRWRPLRRSWL